LKQLLILALLLVTLVIPASVQADDYLTLTLDNKNPDTWERLSDGTSGSLYYNTSGAMFDYSFTATGLEASTGYSLIYYANPYPGNFPGALLGTATTDGSGALSIPAFGGIELGMSLPTVPDSNMRTPHNLPPDNYATAYGAKVWLVPSGCYDVVTKSVTSWQPTRFLFETDLINYTDTNLAGEGTTIPTTTTVTEPAATIGINVSPLSLNYGSVAIGSCSDNIPITVTNTGTVSVKVTVTPSAGFYATCMKLNDAAIPAGGLVTATIAPGASVTINSKVCPTTGLSGTLTGSLSLVASFSP
jgi:hypothetical protein